MDFKMADNIWEELKKYIIKENFILATDRNVYNAYKEDIDNLMDGRTSIYIMPSGETNKTHEELMNIYEVLIENKIDRNGIILSLGGGVVGDLVGFAASTYKRGIDYIQVPTTLLSQVDSSIGGKTGIDFQGYKNIVGSFYFPIVSLIETSFIHTLPEREITCGLGEIIKYGLIKDYDFFKYIEKNIKKIYMRDMRIIQHVVKKSIEIKLSFVEEDKLDLGIRQKLNFGHTIGHGIESLFNCERYNHGESIILGMIYESKIAYDRNFIDEEYYREIINILRPLVEEVSFTDEDIKLVLNYMGNDKKNKDNKTAFVLPIGKGKVDIFYDIDEEVIRKSFLSDF
ncbi:3-dehydroquinate synthase [Tissierella sp.]|uniref:3-dehydroquinate synthase n=1 Tax=Tissierella sp. TaxID=41274 RepID=UPI00286572E3|nr:3-dehydroquinate synthase [Tissierella sp.]MDR7857171.1 3-dehydroquinate synthase [Tissierella sp.]